MNKKTDAQKELEGTNRADRKTGESSVKDLILTRVQPLPSFSKDYVSINQELIFKEIQRLLKDAKVITKLDLNLVLRYAIALDVYFKAVQMLNDKGSVQTYEKSGATAVSGWFTAWKQAAEEVNKYDKQLGLTPYIRERIQAYAKEADIENESGFAALMKELKTD